MIEIAVLKNFDSGTYKAGVQLVGSLTTYFDDISVAKNIPSSALVIGNYVIVAIPGGNPRDACVIATWPQGSAGAATFLDLSDTPSSYSGQAGKVAGVAGGEAALEFLSPPLMSMASKTYYIDAVSGNDANGGEASDDAFKTWPKAKSMIPIYLLHNYTIRIIGDLNDAISLGGRTSVEASLIIRGDTDVAADHAVTTVDIFNCYGAFAVQYVQASGRMRTMFCMAMNSINGVFQYCNPRHSGDLGVQIAFGMGYVRDCDFGTDVCEDCIEALMARVISRSNTGNATRWGLNSDQGATLVKLLGQPTGTTSDEHTANGGEIR